jgi:hypothetical protein
MPGLGHPKVVFCGDRCYGEVGLGAITAGEEDPKKLTALARGRLKAKEGSTLLFGRTAY